MLYSASTRVLSKVNSIWSALSLLFFPEVQEQKNKTTIKAIMIIYLFMKLKIYMLK